MRIDLVRIGNSRGIRIPKPIIEQCGFGETVNLRVEGDHLVIARDRRPREGWEEAIRAATAREKDSLLLEGLPANRFDNEEWEW